METKTENYENNGQKIVRDTGGRFAIGGTMTSAEASRRAKGKWDTTLSEMVTAFLEAAGFDPIDNLPQPWVIQTAKQCAKGGSGFASNLRLFFEQVGEAKKESAPAKPKQGTICPACGQYVGRVPPDVALFMVYLIDAHKGGKFQYTGKGDLPRAVRQAKEAGGL